MSRWSAPSGSRDLIAREFERLSADELSALNDSLATSWTTGNHYQSPDWWKDNYYRAPVGDRR